MKKKYYRAFLFSFIITTISLLSGAINWTYQFVIVGLCYLIGGLIYSERRDLKPAIYSLIILFPFYALYSPLAFIERLVHIYPIAILPAITFFMGSLINRVVSNKRKVILSILVIFLISVTGYFGMPNWLSYLWNQNKITENTEFADVNLLTENNEVISISDLPHQVILLDFWSTTCGICIKKFPELQKLYDLYSEDERVGIYSVNLYLKNENLELVKSKDYLAKYTFPNLFTSKTQAVAIQQTFEFNTVPTIVIINGDKILYRGQLFTNDHILVNNAIKMINSAINE